MVAAALQILTANKPLSALLDNSLGDILVMKGCIPYFFTTRKGTYRLFTIALGSSILDWAGFSDKLSSRGVTNLNGKDR